ncbi:MAG: glycosyltransferase [Tissierellaceae bacterium]|nr:glycosyltransferase [Tissierellaceae bacterium]
MGKEKKVILQALMGLDIGGAETHVVELSKELKKRGYRIIVASNGGVYEDILKEEGIELVNVPLHTKSPWAVIKSIEILYKLIKKENINLVHAHARIPAFILSLLQRRLGFTMFTTAHGIFHVNFVLKYITRWGDEVFAVSKEVRNYLLDNYSVKESSIHNNINGINLEEFKIFDDVDEKDYIVHVSRLEKGTSSIARLLIDYGKNNRHRKVIIVGGGEQLESLREEAKSIDNVYLPGKSTDVTDFLGKARIFIGVGRAALEAMSCNIPVILAGTFGYLGLLDEGNIDFAAENNFSARYTNEISYGSLSGDLDLIFQGKASFDYSWERKYIEKNYSLDTMVNKYEKVYKLYLEDEYEES